MTSYIKTSYQPLILKNIYYSPSVLQINIFIVRSWEHTIDK